MAEPANSTPAPGFATLRLDLQPQFLALNEKLSDLKHLAAIAETVRDHSLRVTDWNWSSEDVKKQGYRPILMTLEQMEALDFIISHIKDAAACAFDLYDKMVSESFGVAPCV